MKLYYFEGIGYTDTPLFSSLEEQETFFESKVVANLDGYYPPYFMNRIEVPSDYYDYNELLNEKVNYLSLDFKGKTYYYFIINIDYLSENVYALDIKMDTIQTFLFDINYTNARINRMLIQRWKNGHINRDYIRENYSNNSFRITQYQNISFDETLYDTGLIVCKVPSSTSYDPVGIYSGIGFTTTYADSDLLNHMNDSSSIIVIPAGIIPNSLYKQYTHAADVSPRILIQWRSNISKVWNEVRLSDLYLTIREYAENPKLIDMYYIPYNPFQDIQISTATEIRDGQEYLLIRYFVDNSSPSRFKVNITTPDIKVERAILNIKDTTIDSGFKENTLGLLPFNYKFIPQLLDENYVSIELGEKSNTTNYPLHLLELPRLLGLYFIDVLSGFRSYRLVSTLNYSIMDPYNTTKVINTKEQATIYNDAWKTFASQNQGSLTLGRLFNLGLEATKTNPSLANFASQIAGDVTNRLNKMFTPDTMTQGNTYSSDVFNNALDTIKVVKECTNIKDVATIYESIGYMVDKYIAGSPLSLNTRKGYNYYECSEINFGNYSFITRDIENDIKKRWSDGLRFWTYHPDSTSGHFMNSDNIGNVCQYDNIEISRE